MKSLRIYLIIAVLLVVVYAVMQYNRPTPTNWSRTYFNTHKIPFGTYILYNQIKNIFPKAKVTPRRRPVYEVLVDSTYQNTAYVIIGNNIQPSEEDYEQLISYINAGNNVFIAADNFGSLIDKNLKTEANYVFWEDENVEFVSFVNPKLNNERQYFVDKGQIGGGFNKIDSTKAIILGENDKGEANFIKYKIGKGTLYLMPNPGMFTNYSLLKDNGRRYASIALSHLGKPKQILWDEYYTQGLAAQESPMRVFLSSPYLRSAYYLALFSLLVYVLYGIKRRQRVIPVVEPLKNATLDFINVVGQVYYERRDNVDIAQKKIIYFLSSLRDKYWLKTGKMDNEFTETLAHKTGIDKAFSRELVNYINYIAHQQKVTDNELIELNRLMEKFYTLSA
ncbi:DUF4350 domain-containing protein [Mucilaginibacter limnophilus]|uniref:DUF4350 domain-containing protein n=1 Tax=Mucilaginibacter limnophilus TaxID=1932778 RepID=A0A3S2WZM6_9SPHI|nr:DUF4350 domain-containing protein [Mucilaginibacter limnophilus]RVU01920.1 DUF4350 domain-containing protein [Mucilaginibacter limnophilus]